MRRQFTPEQKARVALAALAGDKTINQVAAQFEVHPTQVKKWRDAARSALPEAFTDGRKVDKTAQNTQAQIDELHRVIGVRDAELEWLKKSSMGWSTESQSPRELTQFIDPDHPDLTISRQAELLGL
jgi:putative transposase